jgi:hypothetical protein
MPLTEAALAKPTSQELHFDMTADEMQARGLDPHTGKPTRRRDHHRPHYDDVDVADDVGVAADTRQGTHVDADAPIVRGAARGACHLVALSRQGGPSALRRVDRHRHRPADPTARVATSRATRASGVIVARVRSDRTDGDVVGL